MNYNSVDGSTSAASPLYNGNIAEAFWQSGADGDLVYRGYGYKYDNLNRLKDATYQKTGGILNNYDENLTYDKNGNILSLMRMGNSDTQSIKFLIDELKYEYTSPTSNQLAKVTEGVNGNSSQGFIDGNTTGNDYEYDANGNMTVDKNKHITAITYNHLNLPTKIIFTTGNIVYIYTASGQKMQKIVTDGTNTTTTDYLGGYQYQNTVLQFFLTAEGYVKNTPVSGTNSYSYVFNYTDHLGNVRISYTQNPSTNTLTILDENSYYPFGLKHTVSNAVVQGQDYKYKYNGKELQDELGLNVTAMDYRQYDSAIGRFNSIDRLSETAFSLTPYRFAFNNPNNFSDPSGLSEFENNNQGLALCPTCPNTPVFKPLIDDPNNTYVYDPETMTANKVIQLDEVVVQGKPKAKSSDPLFWINSALGFTSTYVGYKSDFLIRNELWHLDNKGVIHTFLEKNWSKYLNVRKFQTTGVKSIRKFGDKLAYLSLVSTAYNVVDTGKLKASDVLYATMAGASLTGVGSVAAGAFFIADLATMGTTYMMTGNATSIGDYLDENTNGGIILEKNDFKDE